MNLMQQLIQKMYGRRRKPKKGTPSPAGAIKKAVSKKIKLNPKRHKTTNYVKPTGRYARRMRRKTG